MKITDIKQQVNNPNRYSLFIDGKFAFGVEDTDVISYRLSIDSEISKEKLTEIYKSAVFSKARDKAIKFLSYKPRTEKEIWDKLEQSEFSEYTIRKVIELLKKYSYVNDKEYARAYIKDRFNLKGHSVKKISYELKSKGIDEEVIQETIDEFDFDEAGRVYELIKKRLRKSPEPTEKEKQSCYNYMLRRGYSYAVINEAFSLYDGRNKD